MSLVVSYSFKAGGQLFLKILSSKQQYADISLMDIGGREMKRFSMQLNLGENLFPIDVNDLTWGYYILTVKSQTINISRKLMIIE